MAPQVIKSRLIDPTQQYILTVWNDISIAEKLFSRVSSSLWLLHTCTLSLSLSQLIKLPSRSIISLPTSLVLLSTAYWNPNFFSIYWNPNFFFGHILKPYYQCMYSNSTNCIRSSELKTKATWCYRHLMLSLN